jgi:hypothetical protein
VALGIDPHQVGPAATAQRHFGKAPHVVAREQATDAAPEHPVLVDKFLEDAFEFDVDAVADAIRYWILQRGRAEMPPKHELSLERNVEETLAVLELAAREKQR